jgi:hypothetical protein
MFCQPTLRPRDPCPEFQTDSVRKITAKLTHFRTSKQFLTLRPGIAPGLFARCVFLFVKDRHHPLLIRVFPAGSERQASGCGTHCTREDRPTVGNNTRQQHLSKGLLSLWQGRPARISISNHGRFTNANQSTSNRSHYSTHRLRGGDGSGSERLNYRDHRRSE